MISLLPPLVCTPFAASPPASSNVQPVTMPVDAAASKALEQELVAFCRTELADLKCPRSIDFRAGNAMDYAWRADGPWDLIVINDTICYLGWLYSFFDVAWFVSEIHGAIRPGGRFLMANTMDLKGYDKLLLPYVTRSYRDLALNVGFALDYVEVEADDVEADVDDCWAAACWATTAFTVWGWVSINTR
ncbi:MAG: hypothetical protein HC853_06245 [Anaerolineae bacterium]|nr:hypothetical protein [Anaerolineae bacterium]